MFHDVLFEDDGEGYEHTYGGYLSTHYVTELSWSITIVEVSNTEGSRRRPK
ncbi:hypothetical protein DsansV1_C29g0210791 [Dioscorea sansibarensis]